MDSADARDPHAIAGWVVAVAQALDARGADSKAIFDDAGIDLNVAKNPTARFPSGRMTRVYELAYEITGDPSYMYFLAIGELSHSDGSLQKSMLRPPNP